MKKGFTLIELLAVIVILSIIGLITVPIVVSNIERSRVSTYRTNTQTLMEASKQYVSKAMDNNDFPESGIDIKDLDIKKGNFKSGIIKRCNEKDVKEGNCTSDEIGEIIAVNVYNGRYCAKGTKQGIEVAKVESEKDCNTIDSTAPELALKVIRRTNNSILVAAYGYDSQSEITKYTFKIGNGEAKVVETSSGVAKYEFTGLKANQEYTITATVENENTGNENENTYRNEKSIKVTTLATNIPTFKISGSGYSNSKEVTITYPEIEGGKNYYDITYDSGKTWTTTKVNENTTKVLFTKNGKIRAYTKYNGGEVENTLYVIGIDEGGPTIQKIINSTEWEISKEVTGIAVDSGSGLADKPYSFDGGKTWSVKNTKSFKENQIINFVVKDKMGNKTYQNITINKIDTVKPTCELKVTSGTPGTNGWYKSNVTINFSKVNDQANDIDGIKKISGSGIKKQSINKSTIKEDGTYTITGTVVDKVGNKNTCTLTVKKDATPPVPTLNISGTAYGTGYQSGAIVATTCQEKTSGIASKTNNQTLTTAGSNSVTGTCVDKAGNSSSKSATYNIYVYSKDAKCGVASYKTCQNAACGCQQYNTKRDSSCGCETYKSCSKSSFGCKKYKSKRDSSCGCETYKKCRNSACGCDKYKKCTHKDCGQDTVCTSYNTCQNAACGETEYCSQYSCTLYKSCKLTRTVCGNTTAQASCPSGYTKKGNRFQGCNGSPWGVNCVQNSASRQAGCGTETVTGSACDNAQSRHCSQTSKKTNSCATAACGCASTKKVNKTCRTKKCGCEKYKSCRTSGCGCETYKSCRKEKFGCEEYNTKRDSSCGCETYKSCSKSSFGCKKYKSCQNAACGIASYKSCWHL